jgi:mycoredoxin
VTTQPSAHRPTIYTTRWCGYCVRLKSQLTRANVAYAEVDIERDDDAALTVAQLNDGNLTVPTVVFADGTALTNPSVSQVKQQLAA